MRNFITLLTAATLIIACADEPRPTAPVSGTSTTSTSPNHQATADRAPVTDAKPADQVGFTKVIQVLSTAAVVPAGGFVGATATCPAGTTAISGGHQFVQWTGSAAAPQLVQNQRDWSNGWMVWFYNDAPGAVQFTFKAIAYCAS